MHCPWTFTKVDLQQKERDFQQIVSSTTNSSILMQNEIAEQKLTSENENSFIGVRHENSAAAFDNNGRVNNTTAVATKKCFQASSSSVNSFVEAILDKDREMCSEFPELFEESFEY